MGIRKRMLCLFLIIALLFSLSGCILFSFGVTDLDSLRPIVHDFRDDIVPFGEMEYERPSVSELSELADEVTELVDGDEVSSELISALDDFYLAYRHYLTMSNLVMIRSDLESSDSYLAEENALCSQMSAKAEQILSDLLRYCANSSICDELDEVYFDGYLAENYAEGEGYNYTDRIVELLSEESRLVSEYEALSVEMLYVDIDETECWDDFNSDAAEIYIELIKVRRSLAEEFGYDSYVEMAYDDFGRDYSPDDIEKYTEAIKKHISPLYEKALLNGSFYSMFNVGSMRPERSFRTVQKCLSALDPTLDECMSFMKKYDLYDISDSSGKILSSYTTYLQDYDSPFLFVCPDSTKADILTIAHEFGHFCDEYINYDEDYSLDTMEMLSQGMEYMLIANLEDEELKEELRAYKLADVLALYVDQGCYSEFEHRAYALPDSELTVDGLNELFAEVADDYGFSLAYYEEYLNYIWIQVPHMFEYPFYIISYCVSDSAAFNLYMMELENKGSGFEAYMELLSDSDAADFLELIEQHDLPDPISPRTIKNIAKIIKSEIAA